MIIIYIYNGFISPVIWGHPDLQYWRSGPGRTLLHPCLRAAQTLQCNVSTAYPSWI